MIVSKLFFRYLEKQQEKKEILLLLLSLPFVFTHLLCVSLHCPTPQKKKKTKKKRNLFSLSSLPSCPPFGYNPCQHYLKMKVKGERKRKNDNKIFCSFENILLEDKKMKCTYDVFSCFISLSLSLSLPETCFSFMIHKKRETFDLKEILIKGKDG